MLNFRWFWKLLLFGADDCIISIQCIHIRPLLRLSIDGKEPIYGKSFLDWWICKWLTIIVKKFYLQFCEEWEEGILCLSIFGSKDYLWLYNSTPRPLSSKIKQDTSFYSNHSREVQEEFCCFFVLATWYTNLI